MHDGQNLFDGSLNWTKKAWRADVAVDNLVKSGRIADTIMVVGIRNNGIDRYAEMTLKNSSLMRPRRHVANMRSKPVTGASRLMPTCVSSSRN